MDNFRQKVADLNRIALVDLDDTTAVDPENWDSLEVLEVIALIDEAFGVTVPTVELYRCSTFGDLHRLIRAVSTGAGGS